MITRTQLRLTTSLRYSWRNIAYSAACASLAVVLLATPPSLVVELPVAVVAILGTALAIILGFKNSSAYDRWWEARKIWGGVVNESRTLTRQALHMHAAAGHEEAVRKAMPILVRLQLAWVNALRLQLRRIKEEQAWIDSVHAHLSEDQRVFLASRTNKVTALSKLQGELVGGLRRSGAIDGFQYMVLDGTLARLTDLQGMAERIRATPLPRPYEYYTKAFLQVFIFFLPFGIIHTMHASGNAWAVVPVTVVVAWIFHQLYVFGRVMSNPFENWQTDVPLDAICTTIAIDLKEALGDSDAPVPLEPVDGVLM
ncbi:MAG: hypothetical protein JNM31_05350 [Flavobacteriales bacterium]|nr:hypothetical protein [Flavobacteriales bacterium]